MQAHRKAASGVVGSMHYSLAGVQGSAISTPYEAGSVALSLLCASSHKHWVLISETARRVLWPNGAAVSNATMQRALKRLIGVARRQCGSDITGGRHVDLQAQEENSATGKRTVSMMGASTAFC
jgi:hypothetical protein